MDNSYPFEKDIDIKPIIFPKYSKSSLLNKKLIIDEKATKRSITKIIYTNGEYYERTDLELVLPNGEKFKGLLNDDSNKIKRGHYFWPNGQEYYGQFDDKNNFFTLEGEISKLKFSNGDLFEGTFERGQIGEGKYTTKDGREITTDFTGGKINGLINLDDKQNGFKFEGYIENNKKEGPCTTEITIKGKTYSIKGEYIEGLKEGIFKIREIAPQKDNFYLKGKYREGLRHGFFDIIDKDQGIDIKHKYFSFLNEKYKKKYCENCKTNLTGLESSISITCRDKPIKQLTDLVQIRLGNLLTLDISRNKINSLSFLNTEDKTLYSLHNLILSYNKIKSIEPLVSVFYPKLKKLMLNDNKIDNITCIQNFNFEELEELNLSNNPFESLEGAELWKFPNLFNLSLYRTNINDIKPLTEAEFPSLVQIDIYFTKIKPNKKITPKLFKSCKSLKNVILDRHY